MALFKYTPIDLDRPAVRFVRLLKESQWDDIRCELFEGWIQQPEGGMPYDALSYTWGSTEKNDKITVNGSLMYITSNLYAALWDLRLNELDRILWIDAICIDQANDLERGHQVQQMSDIYKEAQQVIVWLGWGTTHTDVIMDFMKRLQDINLNVQGDWRPLAHISSSWELENKDRDMDRLREGMNSLLCLPWFKRVWILQEIANAKAATILCGKKAISARVFAQTPSLIGLTPNSHCQAIIDIMPGFSRNESWWAEKRDLHTLLLKFRDSEATEERDIIYALLGLSSDAYKSDVLLPNYTKSIKQVIRDTTLFLLSLTSQENLLHEFLNWTLPEFLGKLDSLSSAVLEIASENGLEVVVKRLLTADQVRPYLKDKNLQTPLHRVASKGHTGAVRLLLENGATFEERDWQGFTPLLLAVKHRHEGIVRALVEEGAALEAKGDNGLTPLLLAVKHKHEGIVRALVEKGAAIEAKGDNGLTPLLLAAKNKHKGIVRALVEKGAALEAKDKNGHTPLLITVSQENRRHLMLRSYRRADENEAIARLLLEKGAAIEVKGDEGLTPLLLAVKHKHEDIVRALVEKGAALEAKGGDGLTPLLLAVKHGHEGIVRALVEEGAALEAKGDDGLTPLLFAVKHKYEGIVRALVEKGAAIEANDENGHTPLLLAVKNEHVDIVRALVEKGAALEAKDKNGHTPLLITVSQENRRHLMLGSHIRADENEAIARLLVEKGAVLEAKGNDGLTPLLLAVKHKHEGIVRALVEKGAALKAKDENGNTPLSLAARDGQYGIARTLMKYAGPSRARESRAFEE